MEEKANPELHLLVLPRWAPEADLQGHGTEELRINHSCTQVWSSAAGGNDSQPRISSPDYVQGRYVLGDGWLWYRRNQFRQRRHPLSVIGVAISVCFCLLTACNRTSRQSLYPDARQ